MSDKLIIPSSIIVAGLIIGAAIYWGGTGQSPNTDTNPSTAGQNQTVDARAVDPAQDHILGNPAADVFVIEYSDLECPFCKRYHDGALSQLKERYGDNDRVAFVFRHFPLDEPYTRPLHPTATEEAIASECVARLGGTDAFYNFVDQIFATTASDGQYDLSKLSEQAVTAGVEESAFNTCYENKDTEALVAEDFQDGVNAGVQGTPSVFIQTAEGKTYPAVPDFNALKVAIDAYLDELK